MFAFAIDTTFLLIFLWQLSHVGKCFVIYWYLIVGQDISIRNRLGLNAREVGLLNGTQILHEPIVLKVCNTRTITFASALAGHSSLFIHSIQ